MFGAIAIYFAPAYLWHRPRSWRLVGGFLNQKPAVERELELLKLSVTNK